MTGVWGRRDGLVPFCGRPGNGEIGCRGLRWQRRSDLRCAGKIRVRGIGIGRDDEVKGKRWQERDPDPAHSHCSTLRDSAPAPRVRRSVDRPAVLDARDPYVLPCAWYAHLPVEWGICLPPSCRGQRGGAAEGMRGEAVALVRNDVITACVSKSEGPAQFIF